MLDKDALTGTPVLLGATAGTAGHSLVLEHAMRPLFAYLRAVAVPTAVFAASEDWAGGDRREPRARRARSTRAAGELADVVAGRSGGSPSSGARDPSRVRSAGTPSFEELLRGGR